LTVKHLVREEISRSIICPLVPSDLGEGVLFIEIVQCCPRNGKINDEGIYIILRIGLLVLRGWVFGDGEQDFAGRQG